MDRLVKVIHELAPQQVVDAHTKALNKYLKASEFLSLRDAERLSSKIYPYVALPVNVSNLMRWNYYKYGITMAIQSSRFGVPTVNSAWESTIHNPGAYSVQLSVVADKPTSHWRSVPQPHKHIDIFLTQSSGHYVRTYVKNNKVLIVTSGMNIQLFFLIRYALAILQQTGHLPSDKITELIDKKKADQVIHACDTKDIEWLFDDLYKEIADECEPYRQQIIGETFKGFIKLFKDNPVARLKSKLNELKSLYKEQISAIRTTINKIETTQKEILFTELHKEKQDKELLEFTDFLVKSPYFESLTLSTQDSYILNIKTPAWADDEVVKHLLTTNSSNTTKTFAHKQLIEDVFIHNKYEIMFRGVFRIIQQDTSVSNNQIEVYPRPNETSLNNCIPNPHTCIHSCLGNNQTAILDACHHRDFKHMFLLMVNASGNINFADGVVLPSFYSQIVKQAHNTNKFIRDTETGEYYTLREYYDKEGKRDEVHTNE